MRKTFAILSLIAVPFTACSTTNEIAETTTTTVPEPTLTETGTACIRIGAAQNDPTIFNLEWLGNEMDYEPLPGANNGGVWYMNGVEIGRAEAEDEAFDACGPTLLIEKL